MQESPGSDRETIETYSPLSHRFQINYEITYTAYSKKMHTKKTNIREHLNNIHRETTPVMKLNQRLSSINSICRWVFSTSSLLAPLFLLLFDF
jgi:hypothetical protein